MSSEEPPGHAQRDTDETSPQTGGGMQPETEPEDAGAATGEDAERQDDDGPRASPRRSPRASEADQRS